METSAKREVHADGSVSISRNRQRVLVTVPKPGVIFVLSSGGGETTVDAAVMDELAAEIRRSGDVALFVDMRDVKGLALETRKKAMPWAKENKSKISCAHILVGSRLVEIALKVVAVFAGGRLEIYGKPEALLAALKRDVPDLAALPTMPATG